MEIVSVNGIDLAYERRGRGNPLVLLHGYPLDHSIWNVVATKLENEFDLILPDLRGFGRSTTVEVSYTLNDFAADITRLLDHLRIQNTAIVGHSMGGYVALAIAHRYPDRINGLGLVSSQALADTPERRDGRYKSAAEVQEKGTQGVVETMTTKFTPDPEIQDSVRKTMQRQNPLAFIGALKAMAERVNSTEIMSTFRFPVVLVHGDGDELIPIERAREIKDALPQAHLVELKRVGHLPMLEAPEETAQALLSLK